MLNPQRVVRNCKLCSMTCLGELRWPPLSGGHTAEMLKLLGSLRPDRYTPRCYVVAATDAMGTAKAQSFEQQLRQRSSEQVTGGAA